MIRKSLKEEKAITLVALIITIVLKRLRVGRYEERRI
jgi:hypothetical protein